MRLLLCSIVLSAWGCLLGSQNGYGESIVIQGERVNVRSGPGRTFEVVEFVNRDERFELLEKQNGWLKISVEGTLGWIPQKAVDADNDSLERLLKEADNYFFIQQFTTPPEANAYDLYREVLQRDPDNSHALQRIQQMTATYKRWADVAYSRHEDEKAKIFYQRYLFLGPDDASVRQRLEDLAARTLVLGGARRKLHLRSRPATVESPQLRRMLIHYSFHHPADWGKFGFSPSISGAMQHDYVRKDFGDLPVLLDRTTRLMWQRPVGLEEMNWMQSMQHIAHLNATNAGGFSDWRLPTLEELASLMETRKNESGLYLSSHFGSAPLWCWSADQSSEPGKAWFISFHSGGIGTHAVEDHAFVLAVRSLK
ncbi:hypothetical protein CSB45_06775 [candidate division KSB3 bacterium]|uniref:SH3b domain-containing protein n=1 Tax=candidate division KSB3 bacterium TaxID=2044937 RepID=A0A2G6E606_9BACT|nr:MAG: hypothetical protein CSB45_06775 [candidate division KSB3 bacterium]PIE30061.1 MAG: hypothetical protein CSA57_05820 [candidate division KSB3 bacterium]